MFGLSAGHLIILAIVILLFGSRRLPELGSSLGQGLRAFKKAMDGDGLQKELYSDSLNPTGEKPKSADQGSGDKA